MAKVKTLFWSFILSFALFSSALADGDKKVKIVKKEPVQKRPLVKQGKRPERVVTIKENKQTTVKEYRINGQLRAIKVTPKNGMPPYYLVDTKGTGQFVRMGPDVGADLQLPQWIFYKWK